MTGIQKDRLGLGLFAFIALGNVWVHWGDINVLLWILIASIFCWQNYRAMQLVTKVNALNAELLALLEHLQGMYSKIDHKKEVEKLTVILTRAIHPQDLGEATSNLEKTIRETLNTLEKNDTPTIQK